MPNYLLSTIRIFNIEVSSIADTFLVSVKVLPILLKKISAEVLPILFWQKIDPFYRYFFLYYICFNGLPQFAAVKSLVILGGKIFAPLLTRLSSRHFEIVIFLMHLNGKTAVQIRKVAATCLTNKDVILSVIVQLSIVITKPIFRFSIFMAA